MGKPWTLQDAKNKFSAVVDAAMKGEPQHVTRRGQDAVVVVSSEEYDRLTDLAAQANPKMTFVEHLLSFPELPEGIEIVDPEDRIMIEPRGIDFDQAALPARHDGQIRAFQVAAEPERGWLDRNAIERRAFSGRSDAGRNRARNRQETPDRSPAS